MKVVIVGTGYVGLVSGTCFAELGHNVVCVDTNKTKIENLNKHRIPIFEPGLEELVVKNHQSGHLQFSSSLSSVLEGADFVFIAVGTPMSEDGSADLQYALAVAHEIGEHMTHPLIVVNKSTVPVGTADKVSEAISRNLKARDLSINFDVVSNPEFLKEGSAIQDFMNPDRIVVGANCESSFTKMQELYKPIINENHPLYKMGVKSAEMTKYAANAMLATKISFINEIGNICEALDADINDVCLGIGSDSRIGNKFIDPGCGYGGSCFPKDVTALAKSAKSASVPTLLIDAVEEVNRLQKMVLVEKVKQAFHNKLDNKTFAIWGLSFKPNTNDMREASSITIIKALLALGANVKVYDPEAMPEAKSYYLKDLTNIDYMDNHYAALDNADALLLLTEWDLFKTPDFNVIKQRLKQPIIFDGRNQYSRYHLETLGFQYHQIGVKTKWPS